MRPIDADALRSMAVPHTRGERGWCADIKKWAVLVSDLDDAPTLDLEPVRHGRWVLEAHKVTINCRCNVTAFCSECYHDKGEIWAGNYPGVPDSIALDIALMDADTVKLDNFCPNCGAKMDLEVIEP